MTTRKKPGPAKGSPKVPNSGGSRKGIPNKSTANAREAIARFVDGNADKLNQWLEEVYSNDGPKAAFQCFTDLIEFHVPKLQRTDLSAELSGKDGAPLGLTVKFVKAED